MLMCSKCKKRPAVVFVTAMHGNEKKNDGYCLKCARELGISQVDEMLRSTGLTDEEIDNMTGQLMDITDGDDFELGGSGTMPNFLNSIFGGMTEKDSDSGDTPSNIFEGLGMGSKKEKSADKDKKKKLKFLTNYCTNLTEKAREGKLDNIIGRDREITRVVQILSRRQKNNPCLIGEPGVGKTAIAEGIAQKIVADEVPFHIRGKEVYLLDLTALVAGTQFRGQFESRVKGLVEEVKSLGNVILFIDEVHNLVGTGDSEGTMNAANILKPALSRGEVQVIGATTFKEYRKHIEKDAALERRFQPVTVSEPTVEDTIHILNGIRKYYENHHKVKIDDYTLKMCAVLSERYINDRFLPDKAIDLLDEACACTSIRSVELEEHQKTLDELKKHKDLVESYEASESPDYEILATEKAEVLKLEEKLTELEAKIKEI